MDRAPNMGASAMCCSVLPRGGGSRGGRGADAPFSIGTAMPCDSTTLADDLIRRFKQTYDGLPDWAWPFKPPVPLVGRRYRQGHGLLIYASAENLSWLTDTPAPSRFTSEDAWNRYRAVYEAEGRTSKRFFPTVGIAPVENGGLLSAGLFVADRRRLATRVRPRAFLETIAVSNWCKASIRSSTNRDYIADIKKLTWSLPYVVGELAVLQPAVAVVPAQVWRHDILRAAMRGASPWTDFLPAPQFCATVINCHLRRYHRTAERLHCQLAQTTLAAWMRHLRAIRTAHAWRYMAMLRDVLRSPEN